MFIYEGIPSPHEPLIIPQRAHAAATAHLVQAWGNSSFDRIPHHDDLVEAAALHHHGAFEALDTRSVTSPINGHQMAELLDAEMDIWTSTPVAKAFALQHTLRIAQVSSIRHPELNSTIHKISRKRDQICKKHDLDPHEIQAADKILTLTDKLIFDICAQVSKDRVLSVPTRIDDAEVDIHYQTSPCDNSATIYPWPFNRRNMIFYMNAFVSNGYLDNPQPRLIPIQINQGHASKTDFSNRLMSINQ